jgi:PA14 domain
VLIVLQREVGGVLRSELTRTVHFSSTPLRGQIYYTEYGRGASVPPPSPALGGSCNSPLGNTFIRALDPAGNSAPLNPFATVAPGGCPVCHSVAANGKMFVTADRGWGSGGGVSRINADGTFTPIADSPQPTKPGVDSRGFAYAAITPDGQYVLQGSNLWGNTVNGGSVGGGRLSAGNGNGLYADYFNNKTVSGSPAKSRIDPTVYFDWGTGGPAVGVLTDGFSARWSGKVQPFATETITFETTSSDGVRLWVDNTLIIDKFVNQTNAVWSGALSLIAGKKYDIKLEYFDDTGIASVALRWSGPTVPLQIIPLTQLYAR